MFFFHFFIREFNETNSDQLVQYDDSNGYTLKLGKFHFTTDNNLSPDDNQKYNHGPIFF